MILTFWGVRGGTPVPGSATAQTGGNTVCVGVLDAGGHRAVMDAGTGIIRLGKKLLGEPPGKGQGEIHIFLTHTHWDHIQGIPFFIPAFIPGNRIYLRGRSVSDRPLYDILDGQMKAHYNPIFTLSNMGATIEVQEIGNDPVHFASFTMRTIILPHRGTASLGYRISDGEHTAVLMGDVHYEDAPSDEIVDFVEGADLLVHDAGKNDPSNEEHMAVRLALTAGVKRLILTHYAPEYTDSDVNTLISTAKKAAGAILAVDGATEGLRITL